MILRIVSLSINKNGVAVNKQIKDASNNIVAVIQLFKVRAAKRYIKLMSNGHAANPLTKIIKDVPNNFYAVNNQKQVLDVNLSIKLRQNGVVVE